MVLMVIEGIELVEVVDVKVIDGSRDVVFKSVEVIFFIFSISEGSDLITVVGPNKLEKMSTKSIFSTSGLRTFPLQVILLCDLFPVAFFDKAHSPP